MDRNSITNILAKRAQFKSNYLRFRRTSKRLGISEVLGSLIMIAITLIAGAAAFGFVNGQTGTSANAYGSKVAGNINFLNEREVLTFVNFPAPTMATDTQVTIWIENVGNVPLSAYTIVVTGPFCTAIDNCAPKTGSITITCVQGGSCGVALTPAGSCSGMTNPLKTIPRNNLTAITLTIPPICLITFQASAAPPVPPTAVYSVQFNGQFGSSASYTKNR